MSHIRQKQDAAHQVHLSQQTQDLSAMFKQTIEKAAVVPLPISLTLTDDDLSFFHETDIEMHEELVEDDDSSIVSSGAEPVVDDGERRDESADYQELLAEVLEAPTAAELFDFLPVGDVEMYDKSEAIPSVAHAPDDEAEGELTHHWHPSAGKVYARRDATFTHWKRAFDSHTGPSDSDFAPFQSRLDWEISQWAVKEDISQKSLNRLLQIPQVSCRLCIKKLGFTCPEGERSLGLELSKCSSNVANCG